MPFTTEALFVLLILLPGLVAQHISDAFNPKAARGTVATITGSLVFIVLSYSIYWGIGSLLSQINVTLPQFPVEGVPSAPPQIHVGASLLLLAIGTGLGVGWGWLLESGHLLRLLRNLRITHSTGRNTAWEDAFAEETFGNYVRVHLKDGRVVAGYARYITHPPHRREIYISSHPEFPPTIIWPDETIYEVQGEGILLTDEDNIEMVEFI